MPEKTIRDFKEAMFVAVDKDGTMCHTTIAFSIDSCKQFISSLKKKKWETLLGEGYTINSVTVSIVKLP